MKKLLAMLTAIASTATLFVGCGSTDDDSDEKEKSSGSSSYEDVVEEMVNAINDKDINKIMELSMPDDVVDFIDNVLEMTGNDMGEAFEEEFGKVKLISVERTGDIDEETLTTLEKVYSLVITVSEYMDEEGLDFEDLTEMDDEELEDSPFADLMDIDEDNLDEIESKFTITDSCLAEISLENAKGEEESMEIPLYKIKGEGWNVDMIMYPAMIGYVKKSKQASVNTTANTLRHAFDAAIADMETEGQDVSGTYIISSDESLNYNLSKNFDTDTLYEYVKEYFSDIDKVDYFVVISDYCMYAACTNPDNEEYVGTHPSKSCPDHFEGDHEPYLETSSADASEYTLDELYAMAVEAIDDMD
jgi:hypothetical protein